MLPDKDHPFIVEIYREITYIRANQEDDWTWMDEGIDLLEEGMLESATIRFRELLVAQPEGVDGYEGLALTYREMGDRKRALYFIEQAVARAQDAVDAGAIESESMNELYAERDAILAMPEVNPDEGPGAYPREEPSGGGADLTGDPAEDEP